MSYNTASIRQLLNETFNDEDLIFFCFDYFRPVHEKFSANIGRLVKIQLLIEYCESYEEFDKLLTLIKQKNPRQYRKFASKVKEASQTQNLDISSGKAELEIIFKGNLSEFSPELQYAAVGALAGVLDIPRNYINILAIQAGSIIIQIELPINAAEQLLSLYKTNNFAIEELGIQKITTITKPPLQVLGLTSNNFPDETQSLTNPKSLDAAMIGKIEKAILYAKEPERVTFDEFTVTFNGNHRQHKISYHDGYWQCDCHFFQAHGVCSHVMALERLLLGSVRPSDQYPEDLKIFTTSRKR